MPHAGRSPLLHHLRRAFHAAQQPHPPASPPPISRRHFLAGTAVGMLAIYAGCSLVPAKRNQGARIAVVGAGIAGLNATYLLARAGYDVTLYEGSNHAGGRIQTSRPGAVAPDIRCEIGGEFIDSAHADMRSLARLFHLDLLDTQAGDEAKLHVAYYAGGRLRSEQEVIEAFKPLAAIVQNDHRQASDEITFDHHTPFDAALDATSLQAYFQKNIPYNWLQELLAAAYVDEFGLDLENQSALNFVETIGVDTSNGFAIYGESDQRYKISGGNQQIVDALAQTVRDRLQLQHLLQSLAQTPAGAYGLTFARPGQSSRTVTADIVVLCIPFTILRQVTLDLSLPEAKFKAIRELGYGTNAKLMLGFQTRYWRNTGFSGDSYAALPYQCGWDSSRLQNSSYGTYTVCPGGAQALDLGTASDLDQAVRLLPALNQVFPGAPGQWHGTALRANWPSNPFVRASYAAYRPGQWTSIRGAEATPVGNLHFAGEHTSLDWQGFMNGGAESGRRVAEAILVT